MSNIVRVLSTAELRSALERAGRDYPVEPAYISGSELNILEKIACMQPDVVILDLFMPGQDAIEIIKAYKALYSDFITYFAVLCPFMTCSLKQELNDCGVYRTICLPRYQRELDALLEEVSRNKAASHSSVRSSGMQAVHRLHHRGKMPALTDTNRLDREIDALLNALGLNPADAGRLYLKRAVMLAACVGGEKCPVTRSIYPSVAEEFGTTPSSVERRIRCAIAEAWRSGRSSNSEAYFGYTVDNLRGKPSNSEFIAMLADRIRLDDSGQSAAGPFRELL